MLTMLQQELTSAGLDLHPDKTKILTTDEGVSDTSVDIGSASVGILSPETPHKYLGRRICGRQNLQGEIEVAHRLGQAWGKFHK